MLEAALKTVSGKIEDKKAFMAALRSVHVDTARGPVRYAFEGVSGLGRARNCGIAVARGTLLAFTDDDVLVDRHWMEALLRAAVRDEAHFVFGRSIPHWTAEPPDWFSPLHNGRFALLDPRLHFQNAQVGTPAVARNREEGRRALQPQHPEQAAGHQQGKHRARPSTYASGASSRRSASSRKRSAELSSRSSMGSSPVSPTADHIGLDAACGLSNAGAGEHDRV